MTTPRILVAGIGNIFMGDYGFGCEVTQELMRRQWPEAVKIVDFGICGLDLAYALHDECPVTILVDATPQGHAPGSVYLMKLNPADVACSPACMDAHTMDPTNVLRMLENLGGTTGEILLVGCEPASTEHSERDISEMSEPVRAAVEVAVHCIEALIAEVLTDNHPAVAYDCQQGSCFEFAITHGATS